MDLVRFGKFWLAEKIATGGMAEIFKGIGLTPEGKKQILAIKRILPNYSNDEEFVSLLVDEAKIMVQLNHPNIVPIFEFGKVEGAYYIAMDYVEGATIKDLFKRVRDRKEQFTVDMAVHIVREIGQGLAYAHRKVDDRGESLGIVHRDISPANILISFEGEVKIVDFGISKAANQSHNTRIGVIRGKTGYMSPEQTKSGTPMDQRSDIYSLGIIFYELLSGERLFKAKSVPEALRLIREGKIPDIRSLRSEISPNLEKILLKALSVNPEERYQSADELVDALNEYLTRWEPGRRPIRVTHTDLIGFLRRYYLSEMSVERDEVTSIQLDVPPYSQEPAQGDFSEVTTKVDPPVRQTIAANPLYELSEPERSLQTAVNPVQETGSSQTTSLQDAISASIRFRETLFPRILYGLVGGAAVLLGLLLILRREPKETKSLPTPTPRTAIATAKPNLTTVQLVTDPPKARIFLNGKEITQKGPLELTEIEKKKSFKLRVESPGYISKEIDFRVDEAGPVVKRIVLNPVKDEPLRPPPPKVGPPVKLGSKKPTLKPSLLGVRTTPWSEVYVDGKLIGTTDFIGVVVPSGTHRVRFVNPLLKLKHEITVTFEPGKETKCKFDLNQQTGSCKKN